MLVGHEPKLIGSESFGSLNVLGQESFPFDHELIRAVDFLNRTLKYHGIVFGIAKRDEHLLMTIYEAGTEHGQPEKEQEQAK